MTSSVDRVVEGRELGVLVDVGRRGLRVDRNCRDEHVTSTPTVQCAGKLVHLSRYVGTRVNGRVPLASGELL